MTAGKFESAVLPQRDRAFVFEAFLKIRSRRRQSAQNGLAVVSDYGTRWPL
jgi:hypothetical protein